VPDRGAGVMVSEPSWLGAGAAGAGEGTGAELAAGGC
jgi:hypothetical protein